MDPLTTSKYKKNHTRRILCLACAALLVASIFAPALLSTPLANAAPSTSKRSIPISLKGLPNALKSGDDLSFKIDYTLPEDSYWTSFEIRLKNENWNAIKYTEGWVGNQESGPKTFDVDFELSDSNLSSQVYLIDVIIHSKAVDGTMFDGDASAPLPIYRSGESKARVALCVRLESHVMTNPDGAFVVDPARNMGQIDEVQAILYELAKRPKAHVTFALAPVLLEEWRTIAGGYTLAPTNSDGKPQEVGADDPSAKKYDLVLSSLRAAMQRGQVTLAPLGYSDPDLPSLVDSDLGEDIAAQYARGIAVTSSTVTTSTANGTIPFSLALPSEATDALVDNDITWAVVSDSFATLENGENASSGVYAIKGNGAITALVNDSKSSDAISKRDATAILEGAMDRFGNSEDNAAKPPLISVATISVDSSHTVAFDALKTLDRQPWVTLADTATLASKAAKTDGAKEITLAQPGPLSSPADYWDTVFEARDDARATEAIADPTSEIPLRATRNSLIAESSAWSQPNGDWKDVDRGLAFANDAITTANTMLKAINLEIEPVTLAKNEGEIPLVVSNSGDESLDVLIQVYGTSGLEVLGKQDFKARLEKNDNFFTVPIKLDTNSPSGDLHVNVMAGDKAVDSQTVTVKSSMMNRIFMLTAIALVLIGILIYIRHHVKRANEDAQEPQDAIEELEVEAGEIPDPDSDSGDSSGVPTKTEETEDPDELDASVDDEKEDH